MAPYIADTHALLWYLAGSPQLSPAARSAFDEATVGASEAIVPAIVIAELVMLAEKRRGLVDLVRVVESLQSKPGFRLTSLTPEIALGTRPLCALPDIHDRLIVAEAIELGATIITRDRAIAASGLAPVSW